MTSKPYKQLLINQIKEVINIVHFMMNKYDMDIDESQDRYWNRLINMMIIEGSDEIINR